MKRFGRKIIVFLMVWVALMPSIVAAKSFGDYETSVRALAVYNLREEKLLDSENIDEKMPIASLTKMMTAIVVLEDTELKLADEVTITNEMLADLKGWATAGLKSGMVASVEDLLYELMLPSGGDAGQALAIAAAGSIEEFAEKMNQKAEKLELNNTHFSNPIGRSEDNYSSAGDMAKLLIYALKNEDFKKIFEANEYESAALGKKIKKTVDLAGNNLDGAKTGFVYEGRSLASTAKRAGVEYLVVVLNADWKSVKHIEDSLAIYRYFGENYRYRKLLDGSEVIWRIPVRDAELEEYEIRGEDFEFFLKNDYDVKMLEYEFEGVSEINRRMREEDRLGRLKIVKDGEEIYGQEFYLEGNIAYHKHIVEVAIVTVVVAGASVVMMWLTRGKKKAKKRVRAVAILSVAVGFGVTSVGIMLFVPRDAGWVKVKIEKEFGEEVAVEAVPEGAVLEDAEGPVKEEKKVTNRNNGGRDILMLINPNFPVTVDWITARRKQLVNITQLYGIREGNSGNGVPLMDAEAAEHLNRMLADYRAAYPGHEMTTRSCFRARGTTCGRLCYETGTSDHHTGLTCDLIDSAYGNELNTDYYNQHPEWQWLKANSYKYGFIDRFPYEWAGGPMSAPRVVNAEGSTGLYETWHYRYVGVQAATEIATGKYNGGKYDSLEHYLLMTGRITNLLNR